MDANPNGLDSTQPLPPLRWGALSIAALAAGVYLLLGIAGIAFATDSGYASPIFPAAGFAVAVMLWSGGRAWPGLWVGSFLLNLGVAAWHGNVDAHSLGAAAAIGCGAVLQGVAARWLLVRSVGVGWQTLESERHIFRALALAGPAACLIGASCGVATLHAAGLLSGADAAFAWWSWWSGDTLGVLVVLPLSLTAFYRDRLPWSGRATTLGIPMVTALVIVGGALHVVDRWERAQQRSLLAADGQTLAQLLGQRIVAHEASLSALARLIEVTPDMSYAQFEHFTRITLQDNPDIFALSDNPYVRSQDRAAFERAMAAKTGSADFRISEKDAVGRLVRAGERPAYVAVGFIAPLQGNVPALGYDIDSEPARHDAVLRAQASGRAAVTAPLQLVQDNQPRVGVLLLAPAHAAGEAFASRSSVPAGYAVAVIKVEQMMQIATRAFGVDGLVFQVDDAQAPADRALLYRSSGQACAAGPGLHWRRDLPIADRGWTLTVCPTAAFLQQHRSWWLAFGVGAGGLALAALLQMLLLVSTGRTSIYQRRVFEQTTELDIRGNALEDRSAQLSAVFSLSPDAFVVFAPDGSIRFVNPAFEAMTGIPPATLIGRDDTVLLAELRARSEQPAALGGLGQFFGEAGGQPELATLVLARPRHAVLRVVGIRSSSRRVARVLYFHEITREAEVDRMKSEFLSHAAHELRTPLTIILGYSELLLNATHDEATRHELLDTVYRQSTALVGIINELLDLARIESRQGQDVHIVAVDVVAVVRDALADMVPPGERLALVADLPARPVSVAADPAKLGQALLNVLSNAVKYSPHGGEIRVGIIEEPGRVGITVADQGIGMTPDQLVRYGDRFWRADASGTIAGTGLGAAIVKEILALMRGSVEVRSQAGRGTTVTLWLPRRPT